jgi:hypothetical protein
MVGMWVQAVQKKNATFQARNVAVAILRRLRVTLVFGLCKRSCTIFKTFKQTFVNAVESARDSVSHQTVV